MQDIKKYLQYPSFCPHCGSGEIEGGFHESGDWGHVSQDMACLDCGSTWRDIYGITGIEINNEIHEVQEYKQ